MFLETKRWIWAQWSSEQCVHSGGKVKPHSGWPHAVVTPRNEEHLHQLICMNRCISVKELSMDLNISFNMVEIMLAALEYHSSCQVSPRNTQKRNRKTLRKFVRTYRTNTKLKVTVSWITSLLVMRHGVTITSWSQNSSLHSMEWWHMNYPSKKKFKMQPSAGKVIFSVFWARKAMIFLDLMELRQTINSDHPIVILTKLKTQSSRSRSERMSWFHQYSTLHHATGCWVQKTVHCRSVFPVYF